ncbi:hypothetical protein [Clostridium botulinum]|uniref:hypothetical protein n=1 Tax=Clostridium botulinum TaxID=1491 RepID=UPI000773BC47|nr:hypothetical protein [Clostridium botulinum]APH20859.1 hypothetical protein NPD1_4220 [Clostridium botulinum]APQ71143.1 hypothetical protein RSJ8_4177 [Clostridium botulinum]MBN3352139.1 hypothetical protein [Clostridium botulinum]MBN3379220.1 hypothetical protein [Clostridium botulinum]
MKDKNYIKDDGKIRNCYSNIAKMNLLELMYCRLFLWDWNIISILLEDLEDVIDGFKSLLKFIWDVLKIILLPITLIVTSTIILKQIKTNSKEENINE